MIIIDYKVLSSELLLVSDGEFFEVPSVLMVFRNSGAGIRGASLVPLTVLSVSVCVIRYNTF